jgi:hypothetical protein
MVRRFLLVGLACGCTQDFGQFDGDASATDVAADTTGDVAPPVDATTDVGDSSPKEAAADTGPVDAATDAVACTESGAILFGGHCYFLVTTLQTYQNAMAGCTNAGAHLVSVTTAAEQNAVIALGANTERWNGLYRNNGAATDANYAWITGEGRNNYSAWSPGEPNGSGQCVRFLAGGLWADQNCAATIASICERE